MHDHMCALVRGVVLFVGARDKCFGHGTTSYELVLQFARGRTARVAWPVLCPSAIMRNVAAAMAAWRFG